MCGQALAKYAFGLGFATMAVTSLVFMGMGLPPGHGLGTEILVRFFHAVRASASWHAWLCLWRPRVLEATPCGRRSCVTEVPQSPLSCDAARLGGCSEQGSFACEAGTRTECGITRSPPVASVQT